MKKLMIALSAVALAFGVRADGKYIEGDDFNEAAALPATLTSTGDSALDPKSYDAAPNTFSYISTIGVPNYFRDEDIGSRNSVAVKTPLATPMDWTPAAGAQDMSGLFFDSLVKFTACDADTETPEYDGAKLMVWVKENEDETTANLMVTAGYLKNTDNELEAKTYDCGPVSDYHFAADGNDWCRLTIKARADVAKEGTDSGISGFVVFVNGEKVRVPVGGDYSIGVAGSVADNLASVEKILVDNNRLFLSLIPNDATVEGVSFAGQGAIDDICLTTVEPTKADTTTKFAEDPAVATVTWPTDGSLTSVTINGKAMTVSAGTFTVPAGATVTVAATPTTGYMITDGTIGEWEPEDGDVNAITTAEIKATVEIDGVATPCADLEKAIELIEGASKDAKLTLNADAGAIAINNTEETPIMITIDLNGNTITGTDQDDYAIAVDDSNLFITDSATGGIVDGSACKGGSVAGGDVTIDAGTIKGTTVNVTAVANGVKGDEAAKTTIDLSQTQQWTKDAEGDLYTVTEVKGWAIYLTQGEKENEFLIQDEGDLLDLATNLNKTADFATEGITFKQKVDIPLTETFPGIGAPNAKDNICVKEVTDESQLQTMAENFVNGAFAGTYDGDGKTISGLVIARGDYVGLFNSAYGAMIKNVKVSLGSATGVAEGSTDAAVAAILGVSVDTTVENCQTLKVTDYTELKANKAMAGIVAYAAQGTVIKDCVNNLDITSTDNEKAGGIVACAQNTKNSKLTVKGTGVEINGCTNNGNVTSEAADKVRATGLVSYTDNTVTFKGNNVFSGTLTGTGSSYTYIQSVINLASGTVVVDADATFTVPAAYKTVNQKAVDGLFFATVEGGVATLIKNATVKLNGSYTVMADGAAYEFTEVGSITFDNSLVQTFAPTTDTTKFTLTNEGYVWTCAEKPAGPTSDEGAIGDADPQTGIAKFTPTDPTAKEVTVALNGFTGRVSFPGTIETIKGVPANQIIVLNSKGHSIDASAFVGGDDKGYSTALTDAAQKPAFATTTEGETAEKPFVVGDETVAVGVQTINGLIYQLQAEAALDNSWTAVNEPVEGNGQPMTFSADKTDAPAQFYSIKVSK